MTRRLRSVPAAVAATSLLALAGVGLAAPGDLDSSFDGDGTLTVDYGGVDTANGVLVQPDGKVITAGGGGTTAGGTFAVTRVNADGSPDLSFGNQPVNFQGGPDFAQAIARQADGGLVVVGATVRAADNDNVAVARLRAADGQLDPSFAPGLSPTDLDPANGRLELDLGGARDRANDVLIEPDGRIVIAGQGGAGNATVTRLNTDGSVSPGFATQFVEFTGAADGAQAVARAPDGKLVIAGGTSGGGASNFAVARLLPGGGLDTSFSPDPPNDGAGVRELFFAGAAGAFDVAVQPDRKIVAVGWGFPSQDLIVARLNEDGSDDTTFDGDGVARLDFGTAVDQGAAVALQPDGKIIVAVNNGNPLIPVANGTPTILRFQPAGALDTTFSGDGRAPVPFGATAFFRGLALAPDGRIVAAGQAFLNGSDVAVARLQSDPGAGAGGGPGGGPGAGAAGRPPRCGGRTATIVGTAGKDRLRGTKRADVIVALGGNDTVAAGAGADLVCGGGGNDRLGGGGGKDRLLGGPGRDRLAGGPGLDRLVGQAGRDILLGGAGRDVCVGGAARDRAVCERGS